MVADVSANVSSRRAWTRANSAPTCRSHLAKSSEGKAAPTPGAREEDPDPSRAVVAWGGRLASALAVAAEVPRHAANQPSSKIQAAILATEVVTANYHNGSHHSSPSEVSQQQFQRISLTAEISQSITP